MEDPQVIHKLDAEYFILRINQEMREGREPNPALYENLGRAMFQLAQVQVQEGEL